MFAFVNNGHMPSKAGIEMNHVDLIFNIERSRLRSTNAVFVVAILRNEFSRLAKSMRGGRAGYGAGSSFLMDFNLLSHLKLSSRL